MNLKNFYIIFLLFLTANLFAQNTRFQEALQHKLRTNLTEYLQFQHEQQHQARPEASLENERINFRTDEMGVNDTEEAESELHAAVNPVDTNNLIVAAMRSNPTDFLAPLTFPIYYTKDFGTTWEVSEFNGISDGQFVVGGGDPIIVFDSRGTAYLCWLTLTADFSLSGEISLRFARSEDGGATWTELAPVDSGEIGNILAGDIERFVDKEWLAVDDSDSPFRDNIYAAYLDLRPSSDSSDPEGIESDIILKTKLAADDSFKDGFAKVNSTTYELIQFASIDVDRRGTVHVTFAATEDGANWAMYHAFSNDAGVSFEPETKISDAHLPVLSADEPAHTVVGIDSSRMYFCPHLIIDNSNGVGRDNIYMVWTANGTIEKKTEGLDIYFSMSKDGGRTWSEARILNDDVDPASHQFYPSIDVNSKGTLIVSWYDRREDEANINTHYYMTFSEDGGETFAKNFAVSTQPSDFSAIGANNANFGIGEYTQVISTPNYAIPFWSDGRTNDGNIDLFAAFVPLSIEEEVVGFEEVGTLETNFNLYGPTPNPVKETAYLTLQLTEKKAVSMAIYNATGQLVKIIQNGIVQAGEYSIAVDVKGLSAGTYILRTATDKGLKVKRMVVE